MICFLLAHNYAQQNISDFLDQYISDKSSIQKNNKNSDN